MKELIKTSLGEVEEILGELSDSLEEPDDPPEIVLDEAVDEIIRLNNISVEISGMGYVARFGEHQIYVDTVDEYEFYPVVLLFDLDENDLSNYLYWESDSIVVALYNYMRQCGIEKTMEEIEGACCNLITDVL